MNPFEKIFNYQLLSRLQDGGAAMVTSHERSWLKSMLAHPAAEEAFLPETLDKLRDMLREEPVVDWTPHLLHKAASKEKMVYHPHIRTIRRAIHACSALRIAYSVKSGGSNAHENAIPFKLEYSMVKREWYLLWYDSRKSMLMNTRLSKLAEVSEKPCDPERFARCTAQAKAYLVSRRAEAVIAVVPAYNEELSRILYAFSCFEREVSFDEERDEYRIKLYFSLNEQEYVLSKARFLGKRIRIVENDRLIARMKQTVSWALQRYGVDEGATE
ncbi:WYL domain-containing protein [Paenibacillus sp. MY03]|jgi:predicted DNA-binding transcriptional regulator YafY|uniref:WYL domain-containing protein n=1 Tax=Paenibacillus agaridevorans TaxID=171404 RepID=A0A2R5EW95_9BACL|nr:MULTISPECIES: WYL domain-containing protein [Paenibacillus]OUS74954.1 WYL domain-containing protein [Paenibacillus sp. MY03]QNK59049.1 WYL domain-containing protein [Paenibacillus sp. PAMC21692]GBG10827.1 WYL domain-containing protein [Paenibacillus agaridevorans]